ncbi:MAG: hypothetical protein ABIL09_28030, partial [Gemmatimonadota bacterium]
YCVAALRLHAASGLVHRSLCAMALGAICAIGLQLHTTAFPLAVCLVLVLTHDALRRREGLRAGLLPAGAAFVAAAFLFVPAAIEGMGNGLQNTHRYLSFIAEHRTAGIWSWEGLTRVAAFTSEPWEECMGSAAGYLLLAGALPLAAVVIWRRGWRSRDSMYLGLVCALTGIYALGFATYDGMLQSYYLALLTPLPIAFAAGLPRLLAPGPRRQLAVASCCAVVLLPLPSHLQANAAYLRDRPDTMSHYQEDLEIVSQIAADAGSRRFGIHFQNGRNTDPHHYVYHFGTLARRTRRAVDVVQLQGLSLQPLTYLVIAGGGYPILKLAPGESPDGRAGLSYVVTNVWHQGVYQISQVQEILSPPGPPRD